MKKILLTITVLFVTLLTMAQSPNLMNFQGVARNAVGNVLPNQLIGVRLSILSGGPTGSLVYQESRNVFTNAFGLFNIVMGSAGTLTQTGTIAGVNWSGFPSGGASKYLQVEIDPAAGTNWTSVGSTQMVSVPYALNAGGAAPIGPAGGDLTGTYPNPQIFFPLIKTFNSTTLTPSNTELLSLTNTSPNSANGAITGTSSSNAASTTAITGTLTSTASAAGSAALRGVNQSTNALGAGVVGTQSGGGMGVLGQATSGTGVRGESGGAGVGVYGTSPSGAGVYGTSTSNSAGFFENTNNANTTPALFATTNSNSNGTAVNGVSSGTSGRAGLFQITNAANTSSALEAQTAGSGASWGVRSTSTGTNGAGLFIQSNVANTANNVQSNQAGLGTAGLFQNTNTANTSDALVATTNTTSTTPAAVHGSAGTSGTSVVAKKGVWGDSDTGVGTYGTSSSSIGVAGTTTTGTGVSAFSFTTGTALSATSLTGVSASITSPSGNTATTLVASTAGTGITVAADNSNATNASNTVQVVNANANSGPVIGPNAGGAGLFVRKGAALASYVPNPAAVYVSAADPAAGTAIGIIGVTNNGFGVTGFTFNNGFGVLGQATTANSAGLVGFNSGSGYALVTVGKVQIQGQGAGAGKVLSSDAVGNATWNTFAALGAVTGSGTLNWVPKWTPNGTNLGNSQIFDDGTNVGVGTGSPNGKLDIANTSNTQRGMQVINSSTTNPSSTIFAQNNSVGAADPVESAAVTGLFSPILVATPIIAGPSAIKGISSPTATVGAAGGMGVQGASGNGIGVAGISNNGTGVYAFGVGGTSYALQTNGRVQIQGQGAGAGKILSSDATGNATWNSTVALNIVSGNGTLNVIPKWSPDGNTLANSQIRDDGTRVTIGSFAFNDPNSVNIYPTSVTTPNASLQVGSVGEIFGMYTDDATGRLHFTANNPSIVAGNEIMVLDDDGIRGVGIGAATAMGKLHVSGTHNNTYAVPTTFASATSAIVEQNSTTAVLVSGVQAYANGGGTENYGVFGVSGGSAGANYGGLFLAQAASTGTNIGIFARASAGATNRAAFFQGTVQIVDGTQGAGKVLLSDASGTASWQNKNIGITLQLLNGTQTVMPSGVTIPITSWSTVVSEEGGANYAPGTGEYTITRAGVYNVEANIFWLGFTAPSTINVFSVELNGVPTAAQTTDPAIAGQILNNKIALARRYAVGDKIRISFQQNSGAPQTLFVGASANHFSVQFIHD